MQKVLDGGRLCACQRATVDLERMSGGGSAVRNMFRVSCWCKPAHKLRLKVHTLDTPTRPDTVGRFWRKTGGHQTERSSVIAVG